MLKQRKPLYLPNDTADVRNAIKLITDAGYDLVRPSPYHLKVGPANFYPTTGRVTLDPTTVHPVRGTQAFLDLLGNLTASAELSVAISQSATD